MTELLSSLMIEDDDEVDEVQDRGRLVCQTCERPKRTCWCEFVSKPPVHLGRTRVVIIQHPKEAKRKIRTAKMLQEGLDSESCHLFVRGRVKSIDDTNDNVSEEQRSLRCWLRHPRAFLMFPKSDAVRSDSPELRKLDEIVLVVLDGTWDEAKKIYARSPPLQALPKLMIDINSKSQYVVKTQPNEKCLSTVESVAIALESLEQNPALSESLTKPLLALCSIQISHGAVKHDSKEFKRDIADFKKENCRRRQSNRV